MLSHARESNGLDADGLPMQTSSLPSVARSLATPSLHASFSPRSRAAYATAPCADTEEISVHAAYAYCRRVAREVARTFYYGSLFLPAAKRQAAWALYGFCRTVDDIADEPDLFPQPLDELARWRALLLETYAGRPRGPVMIAWADMLSRFAVPLPPALDLLAGVEMDARGGSFRTFEELRLYCYRVAGTVGLLMSPILGYQDEAALEYAVDLGIAMQLTNILRDIGEDAARGRIYLPEDELTAFGCDRASILRGELTPAFRDVMAFQVARAETYYERGLRGMALLDRDARLAIALSGSLYRAILECIRLREYDVFSARAHISYAGKLAAVPGAWLRARRAR
jgi:phytoene synthase